MSVAEWIFLAAALVTLGGVAYIAFSGGYKAKVYQVIYHLVCRAEQEITGTKRGQERKAQVVSAIHDWLPKWARMFITERDIDLLIELSVKKMKELLAAGANLEKLI